MKFPCPKCQKVLTARDDQAGARVKCPHCGVVLQVPGRAPVQSGAARPAAPQATTPPPAPQRVCPGCGSAVPATAVLCAQCGYDFRPGAAVLRPLAARKRAKGNPKLVVGIGVGAGAAVVLLIALRPSSKSDVPVGGQPAAAGIQPAAPAAPGAPPAVPGAPAGVPQFPRAVVSLPAEMLADAPFDLAKYFASPPPEDNAAPLYLDALFEFSAEPGVCFPKEERDRRQPIVRDRGKRFSDLQTALQQRPGSVSAQAIDAMLAEFEPGFQKLALAQQRKGCVFQIEIGIAALLCHVPAPRDVARAVKLRAGRAADRGDLDQPLQDVEMLLRLTRDVVRRGPFVMVLVAYSVEGIFCGDIVPVILGAKNLNASQCDRLLAILAKHEAERGDPFIEGMRAEYVMLRKILYDSQYPPADWAKEASNEFMRANVRSPGAAFLYSIGVTPSSRDAFNAAAAVDARLAAMGPEDFAAEVKVLNEAYRSWESAAKQPYRERAQEFQRIHKEWLKGIPLMSQVWEEIKAKKRTLASVLLREMLPALPAVSEASTRTLANLRGTQCLIALKRWQLEKGPAGQDLAAITKAAGMAQVPIDAYDDQPFRMATVAGQPVIYSVGPDGKDDGGAVSWNEQHQYKPGGPGDYTFRLSAGAPPGR